MRSASLGRVAMSLALVPAMLAAPAAASRLTCRDGAPNVVVSRRGVGGPAFCNHDEPGDGVCTFAACGPCGFSAHCAGPQMGVCPAGAPLPPDAKVVTVPVNHRVRRFGTTFRCRTPVPCDVEHRCTASTLTCTDGVQTDRTCDYDRQVDGVCTFAFYCLEVCGPSPIGTVVVPIGETRVVQQPRLPRIGVSQLTLRCVRSS